MECLALHKFSYDYDKERLLKEAMDNEGYTPFVDPLTKITIDDWLIKNINIWEKSGFDLSRIIFDP